MDSTAVPGNDVFLLPTPNVFKVKFPFNQDSHPFLPTVEQLLIQSSISALTDVRCLGRIMVFRILSIRRKSQYVCDPWDNYRCFKAKDTSVNPKDFICLMFLKWHLSLRTFVGFYS